MIGHKINSKWLLLVSAGLLLSACADNRGTEDLKRYVEEINRIEALEIESLPIILPTDSHAYSAYSEGNPFSIFNVLPEKSEEPAKAIAPLVFDQGRKREELEKHPLESLTMVGTLSLGKGLWAIVKTFDGTIYRVKKGNYMGTNLGEILQVVESQIVIEETYKSGEGSWKKRKISVALPE